MAGHPDEAVISKTSLLWGLGVGVAIGAQFVSNLGSILQKKSHSLEEHKRFHERKPYTSRPLWWIGMSMVIIGSIADFAALALAAQSIVATLGCLTLVAQVVWAPLILGEKFTTRHYMSTGIILIGVVFAVAFGPHDDSHYEYGALLDRFSNIGFAIYVGIAVFSATVCFAIAQYIENRFDLPPKPMLSDYLDDRKQTMHHNLGRYHRISYGLVSGIVGGQSVLLGKFIGEMLAAAMRGNGLVFRSAPVYTILAVLVLCVVLQIHFLNVGVQKFQSLYVLPTFQATWTLTSVVGGLVVFDEWSSINHSVWNVILFLGGILLTLFGVYYLMNTPAMPEDKSKAEKIFGSLSDSPGGSGRSGCCKCFSSKESIGPLKNEAKIVNDATYTGKQPEQYDDDGGDALSRACTGFAAPTPTPRDHSFHPGQSVARGSKHAST